MSKSEIEDMREFALAGFCLLAMAVPALGDIVEKGREWEDHTVLYHGKEPPRSAFASFASVEEAKAIRPGLCSRRMLLDSETEWRFAYSERP